MGKSSLSAVSHPVCVVLLLQFWEHIIVGPGEEYNVVGQTQNRTLLVLNLAPSRPSRQFKTNDLAKDETQRIVRRLWRDQQ
eukprot:scaffold34279_cov67-Cyclotella_meneghiniana.AAC.4